MSSRNIARRRKRGIQDSREVGDGEEGIRVEDVGFKESLKQVPRHWLRSYNEEHLAVPHPTAN